MDAKPDSNGATPVSSGGPRRVSIATRALHLLPFQIVLRAGDAYFPILLAHLFRLTDSTDVYYRALSVFQLAGSVLFGMFQDSALIPILAGLRKDDPKIIPRLFGTLLTHTLVIGFVVAMMIAGIVALLFQVFWSVDQGSMSLLTRMIPAFTLYLVFTSTRTLFTALLHSEHDFFSPPIGSALGMCVNLLVIVGLHERFGLAVVPYGQLLAEIVASLFLFARLKSRGAVFQWNMERLEPLRRFVRLMSAGVAGGAVTRVNPVIDQWMARQAGVFGGGSTIKNASDVSSVPAALVQASLLSVLLIHLSEDFAKKDFRAFRKKVYRACLSVVAILTAAAIVLYAIRHWLLQLVFLHGKMSFEDVQKITDVFPYFLLGVAPFGALLVLARAHVALENNRILFAMGVLNATSNAIFNVFLVRTMGLRGLALSTSLVQTVIAIVFFILFEKKIRQLVLLEPLPS